MSFNRENHSSVSTRINDLAAMICRLTGSHSEISHAPERLGDVKHSLASIGKLRATGFTPGGNFNQGIQETIEFFKQPQP
jgi:UDP-glucose 4-epimerase